MAAGDVFGFNDDGKLIDHWDGLQQVTATSANGNDVFSQFT